LPPLEAGEKNNMNKSMIGALVVAMALLPSFASAASFAYDVPALSSEDYDVTGTNPTLDQDQGIAAITNVQDMGSFLRVTVTCSSLLVACLGDIVTQ
jgi:hypothetical protein